MLIHRVAIRGDMEAQVELDRIAEAVPGETYGHFRAMLVDKSVNEARIHISRAVLGTRVVDIFGVTPGSTLKELRSAYKRLIIKIHPDKNPQCRDRAMNAMQVLNRAYEIARDVAHDDPNAILRSYVTYEHQMSGAESKRNERQQEQDEQLHEESRRRHVWDERARIQAQRRRESRRLREEAETHLMSAEDEASLNVRSFWKAEAIATDLPVGTRVELRSLDRRADLNGKIGVVRRHILNHTHIHLCRVIVELADGLGTVKVQRECLQRSDLHLILGSRVRIMNLTQRTELNGSEGHVTGFPVDSLRVTIELDEGRGTFNFSRDNVMHISRGTPPLGETTGMIEVNDEGYVAVCSGRHCNCRRLI